jgi:myosin heavy subunit
VISVNPFKEVPIYDDSTIEFYAKAEDLATPLPPHLFSVAQDCFDGILSLGQSQSVVITGESGAGTS